MEETLLGMPPCGSEQPTGVVLFCVCPNAGLHRVLAEAQLHVPTLQKQRTGGVQSAAA
jgi:hypothetical protein